MNLRAFFIALFSCALAIAGNAACSGSSSAADCGASSQGSGAGAPCGGCPSGFTSSTRCVDGAFECSCLPNGEDAGEDTSLPERLPVFVCQQALASPTTRAYCSADDWDVSCDQECLTCRCNGGRWACTTTPSCLDSGGD